MVKIVVGGTLVAQTDDFIKYDIHDTLTGERYTETHSDFVWSILNSYCRDTANNYQYLYPTLKLMNERGYCIEITDKFINCEHVWDLHVLNPPLQA